jgi:chromosome segregation ATPase
MSKFGFLSRRSNPAEQPDEPAATSDNPLEIDEELFSALGAQVGGENEALRNMLLDANNKINELDGIKAAVGKLVDPVGKALREFEAEKSEKVGLQTVLNNTRTAYGKLRNEVGDLEKKLSVSERDCKQLRQDLASAQSLLHTLETTKTDFTIDLAASRAHIADLESNLAQRTGECLALREENRRLDERLVAVDKRVIAIESDLAAARQRMLVFEDEKRAQQVLLDKAGVEAARLTRKLTETEASFNAVTGRLHHAEAAINEASIERARLVTTLDETNERHERERAGQNTRYDSLQARATTLEKVVSDARELLLARAEQIREYERRNGEIAAERNGLHERVSSLQVSLIQFEAKYKEADQTRSAYMDRNGALVRTLTAREAAFAEAKDAEAALAQRVATLEAALTNEKQTAEHKITELNGVLDREKIERALVEGALATARKDFSRAMREVMTLQQAPPAETNPKPPRAANAA